MELDGKRILVVGLGESGLAMARWGGQALWLTITREERRNAMSHGVLAAMASAIDAAQALREVPDPAPR